MTIAELLAVSIAAVATATDVRCRRIPNALTFAGAATAFVYHGCLPAGAGAGTAALGLLTGLAVFFPIFALGAMGAGDVKLMAALGAWLGWLPIMEVALYGAAAGGVFAVVLMLWRGYTRQALVNVSALLSHWSIVGFKPLPALTLEAGQGLRLPYAVPILVGVVVTLWRA